MASKILKFFLPKDRVFFTLFENASANLELIASKLVSCVNESDFNKRAVIIKEMEELEHKNDLLTHQIFIELGQNFITPFDREDIHSLCVSGGKGMSCLSVGCVRWFEDLESRKRWRYRGGRLHSPASAGAYRRQGEVWLLGRSRGSS